MSGLLYYGAGGKLYVGWKPRLDVGGAAVDLEVRRRVEGRTYFSVLVVIRGGDSGIFDWRDQVIFL